MNNPPYTRFDNSSGYNGPAPIPNSGAGQEPQGAET